MEVRHVLETLHPFERKVLPFLKDGIELEDVAEKSGLKKIEVMRALQWLENKGVLRINSVSKEVIELDENGKLYLEKGLPERRFLENLEGKMNIREIRERAKLDDDEVKVCLGILKSKHVIAILGNTIEPTSRRGEILKEGFPEERFLRKLPILSLIHI